MFSHFQFHFALSGFRCVNHHRRFVGGLVRGLRNADDRVAFSSTTGEAAELGGRRSLSGTCSVSTRFIGSCCCSP